MIFRIFGEAFAAPTGGTEVVAWRHLQDVDMKYDKKLKNDFFSKKFIFSMEIIFSKKSKNSKSHFFRKIENFQQKNK